MTALRNSVLTTTELPDGRCVATGSLPPTLVPDERVFEELWNLHPAEHGQIWMHGHFVAMPRWQAVFGADYHYSGETHAGIPVPSLLDPWVEWCREAIDERLNGLVINWYDAALGHYIGRHRDSTRSMVRGAPIVMLSFGETRTFRLRPWRKPGFVDFPVSDGAVFVIPYETNLAWTHEITRSRRCRGRRISLTLRAFETAAAPGRAAKRE